MRKILVIEDDLQARQNLTTILEMEGLQPITAADGTTGITLARQEHPDLDSL